MLAGLDDSVAAPLTPSSPSVRLAIFTLVRGGQDRTDYSVYAVRCRRLHNVSVFNPSPLLFDDLAFHEGNLPDAETVATLEANLNVRFVDARPYGAFTGPPPHIRRRTGDQKRLRQGGYALGYRYMCRFFAMQWIHALSKYEYAMRLDEDVLVHRMVDVLSPLLPPPGGSNVDGKQVYGYARYNFERHEVDEHRARTEAVDGCLRAEQRRHLVHHLAHEPKV